MPPRTDHFAIAIGIDTYPALRRLTSAVGDATKFCEWLTDADGGNVHADNVRLLASPAETVGDRFDARPIQDEIDRVLRDFGAETGQRIGTRLYFYFAGHGIGPEFDDVAMLMANASMVSLTKNIGLRQYRTYFHGTGLFDEVIFILDCCRDPARAQSTNAPDFEIMPVTGRAQHVDDFVVLAARYGEKAFAPFDKTAGERRGILTTAALEALRGNLAALDPKGRITTGTFQVFVKARVKEIAVDEKLKQDPEFPLNSNMVLHEVNLAAVKRLTLQIIAPDRLTSGDLVLREGTGDEEIARRPVAQARAGAPWEVKVLPITRYIIEHSESGENRFLDATKVIQEPHVINF